MKVIYIKRFRELRQWIRHGKPSIYGYTFDLNEFEPTTEEDFEGVTPLSSPVVTTPRRRSKGSTAK